MYFDEILLNCGAFYKKIFESSMMTRHRKIRLSQDYIDLEISYDCSEESDNFPKKLGGFNFILIFF